MNVNELMSREPRAVRIGERLDAVARVLWEMDCGFAPVVDAAGVLVGVVTDRDLCMACYTQGRSLGEIPVTAVMAREVRTCRPEEAIASAMATMQQAQVHRLPVVDARNLLVGVLSTNDLVRGAQSRPAALDGGSVLRLVAAIGQPRRGAAPAAPPKPARPAAETTLSAVTPARTVAAAAPEAPPAAPAPAKARAKAKPKGRKA
ncbi:MAG: CBS domain-containing protein [Planctomycetes bacterium]|nr:CBS domain-containing protein [Planctomycetota bacterium]